MDIYWLEQKQSDVPMGDDWLSASEQARLSRILVAKRRADWRLGRWTAKWALAAYLRRPGNHPELASIEVRPALSGAPDVFIAAQAAPATISLSHRSGTAVCAVAASGTALGCDLEIVEPRSNAFIADYFTPEEQEFFAHAGIEDRSRLATLLWSAKESAAKALRAGLRLDMRWLTAALDDGLAVDGDGASWRPLHVRYIKGQAFHGWWQQSGNFLRTLVAAPWPLPPVPLAPPTLACGEHHSVIINMSTEMAPLPRVVGSRRSG